MIGTFKKNLSLIKRFIYFFIRETIGLFIILFGGVYIAKYILKNKPYYMVFNYHNFSKYNNYSINRGNILDTGYIKNFEKQLIFFKKHFTFLYPSEFFEKGASNGINILLTFDDGYKDNYQFAFPLLKKHNLKCIFFIVSDFIGSSDYLLHDKIRFLIQNSLIDERYDEIPTNLYKGKKNYKLEDINYIDKKFNNNRPSNHLMMSLDQVLSISKSKFQIGNHTKSHKALSFLNFREQYNEISKCQDFIASNTETNSSISIAYPNGLFNKDTIQVLDKINIDYGFTIIPGFNNLSTNHLKLKRIGINVSDSIGTIMVKIFLEIIKMTFK